MTEYLTFTTIKRSTKTHLCDHCLCKIGVHQAYSRVKGITDDGFYNSARHLDCEDAIKFIRQLDDIDENEWLCKIEDIERFGDDLLNKFPEVAKRLQINTETTKQWLIQQSNI